jgi:hypothetical protein
MRAPLGRRSMSAGAVAEGIPIPCASCFGQGGTLGISRLLIVGAVLVAALLPARPASAQGPAAVPPGPHLYVLDLGGTALGDIRAGVHVVNGTMMVVDNALVPSAASAFPNVTVTVP